MNKYFVLSVLSFTLLTGVAFPVQAEETAPKSQEQMLAQIEQLMKLIAELQAKLKTAQGEVRELAQDLAEGAEGDDIKKVQEVLATDPSIFGVKPTGYFGPMTKQALMKFQERYNLEATGRLDEPTREVIKELRKEKVAPGLLVSEEAKARVKARLQDKWKDCDFEAKFRASACEKIKDRNDDEDDMDEDDDDEKSVTRDEARRAVVAAQREVNSFRESIDDMEDDDASDDEIDEALDTLKDAQKEMVDARRALAKNKFYEAYESAKEVSMILAGDDEDGDDDEDDEEDEEEDEEEDSE